MRSLVIGNTDWQQNFFIKLPRPRYILDSLHKSEDPLHPEEQDRLKEILSLFQLKPSGSILHLPGAFRNETWLVETTDGKKVLKRYKTSMDGEQIRFEHSVLRHLEALHFPAPRLSQAQDGSTIVKREDRYYAVFDFLEGCYRYDRYLHFPSQIQPFLYEAGRSIGVLHRALAGYHPEGHNLNGFSSMTGRRWRDTDWYLEKLAACQNRNDQAEPAGKTGVGPVDRLCADAGKLAGRLEEVAFRLAAAELPRGIVHGDYGPYNLLVGPDRQLVVLDFELSRIDWHLLDIASLFSTITSKKSSTDVPRMRVVLEGYRSAAPLPAEELRMLPLIWEFLVIRRLVDLWVQYQTHPSLAVVKEVNRRLSRLDWIRANQSLLQNG